MIASPRDLQGGMGMVGPGRTTGPGLVAKVLTAAWAWYRTAQDRRQLARMSDLMLHDIGLTRADVEREILRPFWQPIDHKALNEQRHLNARRTIKAK